MKRIQAAILIALMAVSLLPAVPMVAHAQSTSGGVEIVTYVVSPMGEVGFFINLTYLRTALGWVGSDIAIYISGDGEAVINDYDVKIAPPGDGRFYVAEVEYVAGTLKLPSEEVLKELTIQGGTYDEASDTGFIYIKVTDGSNVAVSKRVLVVFSPQNYTVVKGLDLADPFGPLNTTNKFCFKINLTKINERLISYKQINFSDTNKTYEVALEFTSGAAGPYTAFEANITNETVVSGPFSYFFDIDMVTATDGFFRFNGTLKDFALPSNGNIATVNLDGIEVTGVVFDLTLNIYLNTSVFLNGSTLVVYKNEESHIEFDGYGLRNLSVSLGILETQVTIYPSIEYLGYSENASTVPGQINPNDQVHLLLRHFPANGVILVTIWRLDGGIFTPLVVDINMTEYGYMTDADGVANITLRLPEATYGGYPYAFTAEVEGLVGIPALNATLHEIVTPRIIPYVEAYAAQADGTFRWPAGGPTAWGDYLLVKGHGFLQEYIDLVAISVDTGRELFDLKELLSYGSTNITVFDNGTFIVIAKIPKETGSDQDFYVLGKGATSHDSGRSVTSFYFSLGDPLVEKVYVNPTPVIVNATYGYIDLGLEPAYPYPAEWESIDNRVFQIEAIGLDPVDFNMVSINITDGVVNLLLDDLVNLTPVNGYLNITNVHVPVVPMSEYDIVVYNSTATGIQIVTDPNSRVVVMPTAAFIDPLNGGYTKLLSLMAVIDVNVTGYGWPANVKMEWDIIELEMLGFANFSIVRFITNTTTEDVYTSSLGAFEGTIRLSLYISNLGTYHLRIHPKDQPDVNDILTVVIGEMPKLIVNVETAKTKVTGDVVDIWIQILFSTGELASEEQIVCVKVSVYAYEDGAKVPLVEGAAPTYMGEGLWHYAFTIDPEYKGKDLAVVVKAKGRYLPYLPIQSAYDIAALTVSGGLVDQIGDVQDSVQQVANAINNLASQVRQIATTLNDIQATLGDIQATLGDINTGITDANDKLDQVITGIGDLNNAISQLGTKLDQTTSNIQSTLDQFKADVQEAVQPASSTARTWGIINAVLILIIGVAIIAALLRRPQ